MTESIRAISDENNQNIWENPKIKAPYIAITEPSLEKIIQSRTSLIATENRSLLSTKTFKKKIIAKFDGVSFSHGCHSKDATYSYPYESNMGVITKTPKLLSQLIKDISIQSN